MDQNIENINVLLCGKSWTDTLKDTLNKAPFTFYDITKTRPISVLEFNNKLVKHPGVTTLKQDEKLFNLLNFDSDAADVLVTKINYFAAKADVILVDTEYLDTAIAQEIFRSCGDPRKTWAIGFRIVPAILAPMYVKGILFPQNILEIRDLILDVYRKYRFKPQGDIEAKPPQNTEKAVKEEDVGESKG